MTVLFIVSQVSYNYDDPFHVSKLLHYVSDHTKACHAFVVKSDLTITYAKYGKDGADVPTPQELEQLLK